MEKYSIIIVEDDRVLATALQKRLGAMGYDVIGVETQGEDAIESAKQRQPDLVLMDILLAGAMSGVQAAEWIAAHLDIPFVYITAVEDSDTLRRAIETGPYGYITKPFTERMLEASIQMALHKHRLEKQLRESEERFRRIYDESPIPILVLDEQGRCAHANAKAITTLGMSVTADLVGASLFDGSLATLDQREKLERGEAIRFQSVVDFGQMEAYGFPPSSRSGQAYFDWTVAPFSHAGYLAQFQDITEQKLAERAALATQKLSHLGTLAAGVAHEINSPLQVITGLSDSLLRRMKEGNEDTGKVLKDLETINRNSWRMADITRALLTYAGAPTGRVGLGNLNQIIQDTLHLMAPRFSTAPNVKTALNLQVDLPEFRCDRSAVSQVVFNLVSNALDAMPDGGRITLRTRHELHNKQVRFEVQDSGTGVPQEARKYLFDPFFTTKPVGMGTGLGLSVAMGIAQAHGGDVWYEDSPTGRGALFVATFSTDLEQSLDTSSAGRYQE